jgi:hypothetical protein
LGRGRAAQRARTVRQGGVGGPGGRHEQRPPVSLVVGRLAEATQAAGTNLALGIEARCRALLAAGDAAESFYREATVRLRGTPHRPELARAHLVYGEWLAAADGR